MPRQWIVWIGELLSVEGIKVLLVTIRYQVICNSRCQEKNVFVDFIKSSMKYGLFLQKTVSKQSVNSMKTAD